MPHRKKLLENFIVIDGGDGSGKDRQADLLGEFLENNGCKIRKTKEPRDIKEGLIIRAILRGELAKPSAKEFQCHWYAWDRRGHIPEILEHLHEGYIVLCVRYDYSSYAYGMADGVSFKDILDVNKEFPRPGTTFLLDIPPEEAIRRIDRDSTRKGRELFEKIEFQKRVLVGFKQLATTQKHLFPEIITINAHRDSEAIAKEISDIVVKRLKIPISQGPYHIPSSNES